MADAPPLAWESQYTRRACHRGKFRGRPRAPYFRAREVGGAIYSCARKVATNNAWEYRSGKLPLDAREVARVDPSRIYFHEHVSGPDRWHWNLADLEIGDSPVLSEVDGLHCITRLMVAGQQLSQKLNERICRFFRAFFHDPAASVFEDDNGCVRGYYLYLLIEGLCIGLFASYRTGWPPSVTESRKLRMRHPRYSAATSGQRRSPAGGNSGPNAEVEVKLNPCRNEGGIQFCVSRYRHRTAEQPVRVDSQPKFLVIGKDLPFLAQSVLCSALQNDTEVVANNEVRDSGIVIFQDDGVRCSQAGIGSKGTPLSDAVGAGQDRRTISNLPKLIQGGDSSLACNGRLGRSATISNAEKFFVTS